MNLSSLNHINWLMLKKKDSNTDLNISIKLKKEEQKFFSEKFNKFFKLEDYIFCLELIECGFKPNIYQKIRLNNILKSKIRSSEINYEQIKMFKSIELYKKVLSFCSCNWESSEEYKNIINFFNDITNEDVIIYLNAIKKFRYLLKFSRERFNFLVWLRDLPLGSLFFHVNNDMPGHGEFVENLYDLKNLLYFADFMMENNQLSLTQIKKMIQHTKKIKKIISYSDTHFSYFDRYQDKFEQYISKYEKDKKMEIKKQRLEKHSHEKENILMKLNSVSAKQKNITNLNVYSIDGLPTNAKDKIDEINEFVNRLNDQNSIQLYNETIAIIVKKFLDIDSEYRASLTNINGLNAEQLMDISLENLKQLFKNRVEQINEEKLSNLSVEHRKTILTV